MERYRGQGATEYLVLLAVVLIVALASVALLGSFTGTVSDAQMEQSRLYWSSTYPIAITQAVAADTSTGGMVLYDDKYVHGNSAVSNDVVVLTLKNNGASPIQIIAVTGGGWINYGTINIEGNDLDLNEQYLSGKKYAPFAPIVDTGTYKAYIMPPKGTGYSDAYTAPLALAPGEETTIAYDFPVYEGAGIYSSNVKGCRPAPAEYIEVPLESLGVMSKTLLIPQFEIYYIANIDGGGSLLKKQIGAKPLIMACQDSITLP